MECVLLFDVSSAGRSGAALLEQHAANARPSRPCASGDRVLVRSWVRNLAVRLTRRLPGHIRAARSGKPTLAPEAAQALIQRATRPAPPGHDLSAREREVLTLMKQGLSNRTIAERLVISPSTADFHVSNILGELGVATRTEAVALAVQHRIVA